MEEILGLLSLKEPIWPYLEEARRLKEKKFGNFVETCAIVNAKSGKCPSDCKFCAQSARYKTGAPEYGLLSEEELIRAASEAARAGIDRFSFVTSGVSLSARELERLMKVIERVRKEYPGLKLCASLGRLERGALEELKAAGLSRYHHNLETSRSFYPQVCTYQKWEDRFRTAERVKEAGLSLCCGGIFGMGESDSQVLEFFESLKVLEVDSVPVNFLHPIKGTPLENASYLSPLKCLALVAAARFVLPEAEIRICGGREYNLRQLQPLLLLPANALMVGNYLTTKGRSLKDDLEMIVDMGLTTNLSVN